MLPPAILLESRLPISASPRIIRKSAQEATRVLFLSFFFIGINAAGHDELEIRREKSVGRMKRNKPTHRLSMAKAGSVIASCTEKLLFFSFSNLCLQIVLDAQLVDKIKLRFNPVDMVFFIRKDFNHHVAADVIMYFISISNRFA